MDIWEIRWDDSYSVGIDKIDSQHKIIIKLINDLNEKLSAGVNREDLDSVMKELYKYTKFHFQEEEELMEKYKFPLFNEHLKMHREFVGRLQTICKNDDIFMDGVSIISFLCEWLINHILEEDKKYSSYAIIK